MSKKAVAVIVGAVSLVSGCASIVDGKDQIVAVEIRNKAVKVTGGTCRLANDKGAWYVGAPGTTTVQRSYDDMDVQCRKTGLTPTTMTIKSSTKALAFGNVIFGGIIGAGIDVANGAAYDYPSPIIVEMADLIEQSTLPQPAAAGYAEALAEWQEADKARRVLAGTGCRTTALPVRFKEQDDNRFYEAQCADGRLFQTLCTAVDCHVLTIYD